MLNVADYKGVYLTLSGILVGIAVLSMIIFGFHLSVDFTGGTLWEFSIAGSNQPTAAQLQTYFQNTLKLPETTITFDNIHDNFLVNLQQITETQHQTYLQQLQAQYPSIQELSFQSTGPSVSASLREDAIIAIILVLIGISLYIAFAFRKVSRPISSWKYGWITLLTLFHDVSIPAGLLAILGHFGKVQIDTNFVVALLVVMGFSVHDTIVVFDRIRENLFTDRSKAKFKDIINASVNQSLARSINTSLTLILVLVALYITGPQTLQYFVLTLLVGVITGIYSSIFVASPALLLLSGKHAKA